MLCMPGALLNRDLLRTSSGCHYILTMQPCNNRSRLCTGKVNHYLLYPVPLRTLAGLSSAVHLPLAVRLLLIFAGTAPLLSKNRSPATAPRVCACSEARSMICD